MCERRPGPRVRGVVAQRGGTVLAQMSGYGAGTITAAIATAFVGFVQWRSRSLPKWRDPGEAIQYFWVMWVGFCLVIGLNNVIRYW